VKRVATFFVRRLAAALFTLLALIAITFIVYWALPSTPATYLYDPQHLTNERIAQANHLFGLDRPKIVQFGSYLWHLARGDFGKSWTGSVLVDNSRLEQPAIGPALFAEVRATLSIILGGAALVVLCALPLGAFAGTRVGSLRDRTISTATLIGVCTHPMVLGLILATEFGAGHLGWLPSGGYCTFGTNHASPCSGPADWASHLVLPWITFALLFVALYTRMIRVSVAETLHEDFVRTARAKGAGEVRMLRSHVLPSASLRVLTMVGMEIGTAIGVCIYIEAAFGIYGLGRQAVSAMGGAITSIDLPLTLAIVTMITLIVVIGNLIVDLLYAVLDPRAGRETARGRTKSVVGGVF
jgi:peptide/nickel transport system permease protein